MQKLRGFRLILRRFQQINRKVLKRIYHTTRIIRPETLMAYMLADDFVRGIRL